MIRSAMSAFVVVCLCFAIMQIPGRPEFVPLPESVATPPLAECLPVPSDPVPVAVPDLSEVWTAVDELDAKLASAEKRLAVLESSRKVQTTTVTPVIRQQITAPAPVVSSTYKARWHNYDGRTARNHAIEVHGFSPGMTDAQLAAAHDAYHDQHGGDPPARTAVVRTVQAQPAAYRTRSTVVQSPMTSNCPGGVCPVQRTTTVQSRGGLFGFGVFGRR